MTAKVADGHRLLKAALIDSEEIRERIVPAEEHVVWWRLFYFSKAGWRVRRAYGQFDWRQIPAGVAVLVPAGLRVEIESSRPRPGEGWLTLFDPGASFSSARFFPTGPDVVHIRDVNDVIGRFCRRMSRLLSLPGAVGHGAEAAALMNRLLGILEHAERLAPETFALPIGYIPPDCDAFAADVAGYMNAHLAERLDRAQLARHLHMSVSSLAHRYSEETGETLGTALRRLRVAAARRLLFTDQPIEDIAEQCGFTDRYHFSRVFRHAEGVTPAEYRTAKEEAGSYRMGIRASVASGGHNTGTEAQLRSVPTILGRQTVAALEPLLHIDLNFWILDYFYTGGVRVFVRGGPKQGRVFEAGTARLYRPHADIREDSRRADKPISNAWLAFHPAPQWDLRRFFADGRYDAVFHDPGGRLGREIQEVVAAAEGGRRIAIAPRVDDILELLLRAVPKDQPNEYVLPAIGDRLGIDPVVERVRLFLQSNLQQSVRMSDVASHVGIPGGELLRTYRQWTGETPMEALHRLRILLAKRLLTNGATVKEASAQAGFANPAHLSRRFKAAEGIRPSDFVEALRRR